MDNSVNEETEIQNQDGLAIIPQPPEYLFGLLGNIPDMDPSFPLRGLLRMAKIYGPIYKVRLIKRDLVVVSNYHYAKEAFDQSRFEKVINPVLEQVRDFLGDGLFTAYPEEENWGKAHRILIPAFGPLAIRKMFSKMLDISLQMIRRWDHMGPNHEINCSDDLTRLAFDTIGLCAFSFRFNEFYSDHPHPFAQQMAEVLIESGKRANRTTIENVLRRWSEQIRQDNVQKMWALADSIIEDRKKNPQPDNHDLLHIMMTTVDPDTGEKLSDENIRRNMCTFLVAGHETTSSTLSFCYCNLLKNPDKLLKAQKEVDDIVGRGLPELKHLNQLKYLDACIKETLRLSSPISVISVHPKEDTLLAGRYPVSKDNVVQILIRGIHHDPAVWGDDVEEFKPERMLNGGFEALPPNAWKPFGNGIRACIGRAFAEQEMIINMALVLQNFQLELADPSYELRLKSTLTIKPEGFQIKVRRRTGLSSSVIPGSILSSQANGDHGENVRSGFPVRTKSADLPVHISVLYGGNSGTCQSLAEDFQSKAVSHGLKTIIGSLDSGTENLSTDGPILIITSSYEGQPPDNAKKFVSWLEKTAAYKESNMFQGVKYAILGVGNSDWASTFFRIPKHVNDLLAQGGAQQIVEPGYIDTKTDPTGPYEDWLDTLWPALEHVTGLDSTTHATAAIQVSIQSSPIKKVLVQDDIKTGIVLRNDELADAEVGAAKRRIEIQLPDDATYTVGDYLVILPRNPPEMVTRVLQRFQLSEDNIISIKNSNKKYLPIDPVPAFEFFSGSVELGTPVTRRQLQLLADHADNEKTKFELEQLAQKGDAYEKLLRKRYSILDMLEEYSVHLPLAAYIDTLPALAPRQFSISSSPLHSRSGSPGVTIASLTYDVLTATAWSRHGIFRGVASTYLASRNPGDRVSCFVRPTAVNFRLPLDLQTPIIMMATGTGIAPMIAFIEERAAIAAGGSQKLGPAILFYGCRDPEKDFLYRKELEEWEKQDVVNVYPAFSRSKVDVQPKYVQDAVWEQRDTVAQMFREGGKIYICGSAERLAKSASAVCKRIYCEKTGETSEAADKWLESHRQERYISDVF